MTRMTRKKWLEGDNPPTLEEPVAVSHRDLDKRNFALLKWACLAASTDPHRLALNSLYIEKKEGEPGARFIGCDGRRLHVVERDIPIFLDEGIHVITRMSKTTIEFCRLHGHNYPNYKLVVPDTSGKLYRQEQLAYPAESGHVARVCMDLDLLLDVRFLQDAFFPQDDDTLKCKTVKTFWSPTENDGMSPVLFRFDEKPRATDAERWCVIMPIRRTTKL